MQFSGMKPNQYTFSDLVDIMSRLRAPDGCPWDREQTHESILSCLVEEAYEFVDAVERNDLPNMREELGDLLLQVVFHAQMAKEAGNFNLDGVLQDICEKLVRRHPHVFGESRLDTADAVQTQWDEVKKTEKSAESRQEHGALGEIPKHLPALLKALKIQKRAGKTGFDWPEWKGSAAKVAEELAEFEVEADRNNAAAAERELGDLLFAAVNLGRFFDVDPERALAGANARFSKRFRSMEKFANAEGKPLEGRTLESMNSLWERAKEQERAGD